MDAVVFLAVLTRGTVIVFKRICTVLLAVVVLTGSGAVAAVAYTPDSGALFNNPMGTVRAQHSLAAKLRATIASAPRHSVIRIAVYSFDRRDLGDALVAACNRGVAVQIVINDNWISGQVKRLRKRLGTNIDPRWKDRCNPRKKPENPASTKQPYPDPSFLKVCYRSCRLRGPGNQHMKIYMFSQAGKADNVIMVGSNNMTYYAARTHWNDTFTVQGRPAMFASYSTVFRQLAEDKSVAQPYLVFTHGDLTTEFGPLQGVPRSQDPVARRLAGITCQALGGTGSKGRTVVRIAMYAWSGDRGRYLANRVADLRRQGCIVRAILSGARKDVKHALRKGGVALRSADLDLDDDKETGFGETPWEHFTHEKWMAVNGTWTGAPYRGVWTGSENWSNKSLQNDEITLQIPRTGAHNAYARHFDAMWNSKRYTRPL
jgi:phosphatidylserine/phosphatidylglycerophosphate/cardiolipin synthase-like enzyme